ncbi:MAG: M36 family metallopeptidase, partial [Bryobacteraceae bacterium]
MKFRATLLFALCAPLFGQPDTIARQCLQNNAADLNLSQADLDGVYISRQYQTVHNGVTHVIFRQRFQGVEVLNAEWLVNIDRDGNVLNAGGQLFPAPKSASAPAQGRAQAAARAAVKAVDPEVAREFVPQINFRAPRAVNGVRFARGPLARDIEGTPVWYAIDGKLLPAWNFFIAHSDAVHRYSVTVHDGTEAILNERPLTFFQSVATPRGLVFERESPQPVSTPGIRVTAAPPVAPRTLQSFRGDPTASPLAWTQGKETAGNNVEAGQNLQGGRFIRPQPAISTNGDFSFPLQLGPGTHPLDYRDAAVTNLFYWMNKAHDLHYQYGFDEQAGNFQVNNFGRGGVGGDLIFAYAHFGSQAVGAGNSQNAFFSLDGAEDDGVQPLVAMYLSAAPGAAGDYYTDGSYDAQVMVHEYTHGVSARLARQVYTTFQGASMGEAWSDFFGLEFTLPDTAPPDGVYAMAEYFRQSWGRGDLRSRPYSTNMEVNALTYANLGNVISAPEVHADGEIWAEALWEMRANLIRQFGVQEGRKRANQLIIDGMKLAVPAASMVDMRDAILLADRVDYKSASQDQIWTAFAKRGLGALAYSDGGATTHIAASFELPSATGAIRLYDDPIVIGEPVRVILQDANYSQPSLRVQLTGASGDVEDLILRRRGSVYVGTLPTRFGDVVNQNNVLDLVPADGISVYYVDANAGGAAKLIQTPGSTMLPYAFSAISRPFEFPNEQRIAVATTTTFVRVQLPFLFRYFDKQYGTALVYRNGLVAFEQPVVTSACTDSVALRKYVAAAALWLPLNLSGSAQPNESLYISRSGDSITFRWAGEYQALGQSPSPVNFAATLFADGGIQFDYGSGNRTVAAASTFSQCGPPATGLSNGHDTYSSTVVSGNYENQISIRYEPGFNQSSLPTAALESPGSGQHVHDILQIRGTSADSGSSLRSVDIFIDGVQRTRLLPAGSNGAFSTALNLAAIGIGPGDHSVTMRVTNARGGFRDLPESPIVFTVDAGGRDALPVVSLDQPRDGDTVSDALVVSGYAYNADLRITNVDLLLDGFTFPISYGQTRNDVCAALSPRPLNCPGIGFGSFYSTVARNPPIPDGPHALQLRIRDQTGRFILSPDTPIRVTVKNDAAAAIVGVLTSPAPNEKLSGIVTVSGYAYSP